MTAIDPVTRKEIEVKDVRVSYYDIPNKLGTMIKTKCVELTVIGNNREWPNWFFYKKFKQLNPSLEV